MRADDDEASWLVLAGEARFWDAEDREVACLGTHQGLFVPPGTAYRYRNTGDGLLVMLRGAAREDPAEASRDLPVGSRTGGTEGISWRRELWPGVDAHPGPFRRFNLRFPLRGESNPPWRALLRSEHLALHASALEPERGEVNLHAHDDEAVWVLLHGEVTFWGGEDDHELATLHPHDGLLIPQDTPYRYQNTGDGYLVMLRYGGRGTPVPPLPAS